MLVYEVAQLALTKILQALLTQPKIQQQTAGFGQGIEQHLVKANQRCQGRGHTQRIAGKIRLRGDFSAKGDDKG